MAASLHNLSVIRAALLGAWDEHLFVQGQLGAALRPPGSPLILAGYQWRRDAALRQLERAVGANFERCGLT